MFLQNKRNCQWNNRQDSLQNGRTLYQLYLRPGWEGLIPKIHKELQKLNFPKNQKYQSTNTAQNWTVWKRNTNEIPPVLLSKAVALCFILQLSRVLFLLLKLVYRVAVSHNVHAHHTWEIPPSPAAPLTHSAPPNITHFSSLVFPTPSHMPHNWSLHTHMFKRKQT